jgi:kynurenine formamidase
VIDCTDSESRQPVRTELLNEVDVNGKAVLFFTGWDHFWGEPEYAEHPFLDEQTAVTLRDRGARLVGIDCLVIDDTADPRRPVHVTLLREGILIVENLTNLGVLSGRQFRLFCVPVKIERAAAFPVRAFAEIEP